MLSSEDLVDETWMRPRLEAARDMDTSASSTEVVKRGWYSIVEVEVMVV